MRRDRHLDRIAARLDRFQPPVHDDLAELRSLCDEDFIAYVRAWLADAPSDSPHTAGLRHSLDKLEAILHAQAAQRQHMVQREGRSA